MAAGGTPRETRFYQTKEEQVMSMIAQLAVAAAVYAIDRPYSYRVPEDMPLLAGMRVLVPFGHGNRRTEGVVLSVQEGDPSGRRAHARRRADSDGQPASPCCVYERALFLHIL